MRKVLHALFSLVLVFVFTIAKGQITIGAVDAGPYGLGSNITVPLNFAGNQSDLPIGTIFELYLSDAAGNFINNGTRLNTFSGIYTPALNGVIPAGTITGIGYKLRVRISNPTNNPPPINLDIPTTFSITGVSIPPFAVNQISPSNQLSGDNIGVCPTAALASRTFILADNDPPGSTVTLSLTNIATGVTTTLTETNNEYSSGALPLGTYSVTATASIVIGGITYKSIRTYILHNTTMQLGLGDNGVSVGCLSANTGGALVSYGIANIESNYPGTIYRINWGDGTIQEFTRSQIINNSNLISHSFTETSCGRGGAPDGSNNNSFQATITTVGVACATGNKSITAYAQVFLNPVANITGNPVGCTNAQMTFTNASQGGTNSDCSDDMDYSWYIDGATIPIKRSRIKDPLLYAFTTSGRHTVRLVAANDVGECSPSEYIFNVCIQNPPQPAFTLPGAAPLTICAPGTIIPSNTTILDTNCDPTVTWSWTVASVVAGGAVAYTNGTNANSREPAFSFTAPGEYALTLTVTTLSCGTFSTTPQKIIVNGPPTAALSPDIKLCENGILRFTQDAGRTQTIFSGTLNDLADTYTWTVSGGAYAFVEGTTLHSKFPSIRFDTFSEYTIKVTHTNTCGTIEDTQVITFTEAPTIDLGLTQLICFNENVTLNPVVTGTLINPAWTGGTGTYNVNTAGIGTYTPSPQEKANGTLTLTYSGTTELAPPCNIISKQLIINIKPQILITGASSETICSQTALNYILTSNSFSSNTTYTWTATGSPSAGGFTNNSSGTATAITDPLTNSDPLNPAVVTYTITPFRDGCFGDPFTLTVTVNPLPVLTVSPGTTPICSGEQLGITMTSNLPNTFYTWSSTVTGVTDGVVTGNVPQPTPLNTDVINNRVSNTGTTQATVTYTITPHYNVTTQNPDGCIGDSRIIEVKIDPALTVANAGQPEDICDRPTYTLNGNTPVVGTGLWTSDTDNPPGVTFNNPTLPNATVSGLTAGQDYTFIWTISAPGACNSTSSQVTITVNTPTNPGQTSTVSTIVCEGTNSGTITLSGNNGTVLSWESSINNGASWQPITNTTSTLNYSNIVATTQYRAVVQNGQCAAANSTITTITVTPATTIANAGADQTLCNETTVQLNAISALKTGETGLWTVSPNLPNTVIVNPTNPSTQVTNLAPGTTYTFTWTITGPSPCGPTNDAVTITDLLPLTNSISSTSTEVCYNQVITITGSSPTGGSGTYAYQWEASSDGTNWGPINGQTGKDLSFQLQSTQSFRRVVSSSSCTAISNVIRVIAQPPIANNTIAANQTICTGIIPAGLTGSIPTGSDGNFNYQWQSSTNGSTWTDINAAVFATYAPPALTTTTLYRRIVSTITCNGDLRSISNTVTITVRPNAEAEYTYTTDQACAPFVINASNVKAVPYPDRNATYSWYANDQLIGTGITFPGYTITTSNTIVTIKLVTTASTGCQPDEMLHDFSTSQAVTPSFTQSAASGCGPLVVNFVNTSSSLQGVTFRWDFGNGQTSSQTMPGGVTFQPDPTGKDTTYTVRLTAITVCGTSSTTSTVFIKAKPISIFSPSRTVGCSPMTVTFTNTSPGSTNTYYYDFGDGTLLTKTDKSPVSHTFITNVVRDYTVKMVSENECGRDESSYTIRVSPNTVLPELVVNANEQTGCAPFTVNFYNNSRGANLFRYDFGDGSTPTITRTAPEVVRHTFTTAGTYTVTLTASNGCSDTTTTEQITVLPQPITGFSADVTLGCPGLAVQFRNTSVDGVSYLWDFGDGSSSTEFQPRHVFSGAQEYYTVSLTATNSLGCTATTTLNQYIHVVPPPMALFNVAPSTVISIPNYTFRFEDESTNNPTIWAWDFGDGTTSSLRNPSHTYPDTGKYVVTLRVSNQQGCFTTTFKTVTIVGVPGYLFVPNSFMPGSPTPELRTFIAKGSGIKSWKFSVFNKWGQTLWETTELNEGRPVQGWDGTYNGVLQPQGVYFWKIDVEFVNGSAWKGMTYDSSAPKKTGVIHLIR